MVLGDTALFARRCLRSLCSLALYVRWDRASGGVRGLEARGDVVECASQV